MPKHPGEDAAEGYKHLTAVGNATTLLIQAARVSPPLIEAARLVDLEIHTLRDEIDRLRHGLFLLQQWDMLTLDDEGHGIATADAPWARQVISEALGRQSGREARSPQPPTTEDG